MIRHLLVASVAGMLISGFAMANPPVDNNDASFRCRFETRDNDTTKKDDMRCFARAVFDRTPIGVENVGHHDRDRLEVVCDDQVVYNDGIRVFLVPDADDTLPSKVDSVFAAVKMDTPRIRVEDLNWTTLTGEYKSELILNGMTVRGRCEFMPNVPVMQ